MALMSKSRPLPAFLSSPALWRRGAVVMGLLLSAQAVWALQVQINDPLSEQWLANEQLSGELQFGSLNAYAGQTGHHPRIDGVYPLSAEGLILQPGQAAGPAAMLYVMGTNPQQAALAVQALELENEAEVYVSYVGDLPLYLSEAQADWQPGTLLNGSQHVLVPNDNSLVPLNGAGGRLSAQPLSAADNSLQLDLALKVAADEPAGPKSGLLTFTLVAQ